jgi:ribosomal protein L4
MGWGDGETGAAGRELTFEDLVENFNGEGIHDAVCTILASKQWKLAQRQLRGGGRSCGRKEKERGMLGRDRTG